MLHLLVESASHSVLLLARHWLLGRFLAVTFWRFEGYTWKLGSPRHKMLWEAKIETGWCLQPSKRSAYCDSHSKYQAKRLAIDVDIGYCKAPLPLGAKLLCREPSWLAVQQILLFQSIAIVNSMYWICFACTVAPFFFYLTKDRFFQWKLMDFPDADDQYEPKGSVIICRSPAKCQWPHWKCAPSPDFVDFCRRCRATFSRALAGTHKISTEEGLQRGWCLVLSLGVSKCFCAGGVHLPCPSLKPYFWTRMVSSFEHPFAFKHPLPFWKIASWTFRCSFLPPVLAPQEQAPVTLWMSQGMSKCVGCSICSIHVTHQSECENAILRRPFVCSISLYLHPNWSAKKCCRKSFQKSISSWGHHFHGKYSGNPKVSPGTFSPATCHNWFENDLESLPLFFSSLQGTLLLLHCIHTSMILLDVNWF